MASETATTPTVAASPTSGPTPSQNEPPREGNSRPSRPRPKRPNYKEIHRFPLPLKVHPLPPLIPHNPISIISVLLSYLTYFISPPHQEVYSAYFDSATSSVHVTDEKAIRALWEMGFFGKGSLSRSEPSWLEREKKRRGLLGVATSEEVTGKRRAERRELKLERARKEREAIAERLKAEAAAREGAAGQPDGVANVTTPTTEKFSLRKAREAKMAEQKQSLARDVPNGATASPERTSPEGAKTVRFSPVVEQKEVVSDPGLSESLPELATGGKKMEEEDVLKNEEHLQLSNEEAFFLVYGLGVLQLYDEQRQSVIPATHLLPLLRRHSYFPPRDPSTPLEPDDPFMISYVVYHHFRSLGWVVRSGVKFGVDYLLYNRGPVFSHAEFAVIILPSYGHPYWSETQERKDRAAKKQDRSWWWLHSVNRVQAQVKKSLVLCYVEVPPPSSPSSDEAEDDIGANLKRYKVREMSIRRWVPNRSRD
ncbi:hypothetical protein VTN02DRAFT_642 [Thermoascus thermophilus]